MLIGSATYSAVLKVGAVEKHRLSCLKVLGDNESWRSGWSRVLVLVIDGAAWSGIWR